MIYIYWTLNSKDTKNSDTMHYETESTLKTDMRQDSSLFIPHYMFKNTPK